MDFGIILKRAWEIIWNHKVLWIFGIFASCGSGGGGGTSGGTNFSFGGSSNSSDFGNLPPNVGRFFSNLEHSIERIAPESIIIIAFSIICFALFLTVILFFLRTYGRVALIKGAHQAELGHSLSFRQLSRDIKDYYWRALGLNLLLGLISFTVLFVFVFAGVLLSVATFGIFLICLIPLLCLLIPVSFAYGVYVEFANNALVVEDLEIGEALSRSWQVLRENLGSVVIMALILLIGGGMLVFLIALPFFFALTPVLFAAISGNLDSAWTSLAVSGVLFLLLIPVMLLLSGIVRAYISSAWTLTYLDITSPSVPAIKASPKPKSSPKTKSKARAAPKKAGPKPRAKK